MPTPAGDNHDVARVPALTPSGAHTEDAPTPQPEDAPTPQTADAATPQTADAATPETARRSRLRTTQVAAGAAYVGASVAVVALDGLPPSLDWLSVWILAGLLIMSLGDVRGWARGVLVDWLPLVAILLAYD